MANNFFYKMTVPGVKTFDNDKSQVVSRNATLDIYLVGLFASGSSDEFIQCFSMDDYHEIFGEDVIVEHNGQNNFSYMAAEMFINANGSVWIKRITSGNELQAEINDGYGTDWPFKFITKYATDIYNGISVVFQSIAYTDNYNLMFYDNNTLLESFTVNFKENTELFFKTVVNQESKRFNVVTDETIQFPLVLDQKPENYGIKRSEGLMLISGIDMTTNKFIDFPIAMQLTNSTTLDKINITTDTIPSGGEYVNSYIVSSVKEGVKTYHPIGVLGTELSFSNYIKGLNNLEDVEIIYPVGDESIVNNLSSRVLKLRKYKDGSDRLENKVYISTDTTSIIDSTELDNISTDAGVLLLIDKISNNKFIGGVGLADDDVITDLHYVNAMQELRNTDKHYHAFEVYTPGYISQVLRMEMASIITARGGDLKYVYDVSMTTNLEKAIQDTNGATIPYLIQGGFPAVESYNKYLNKTQYMPASIFKGVRHMTSRQSNNIWQPVAGLRRGVLENATNVMVTLNDVELAYIANIPNVLNPIVFKKNYGPTLWNINTSQRTQTSMRDENVVDLLIQIKKTLVTYLETYVFELNDTDTEDAIKLTLTEYLDLLRNSGALYDYTLLVGQQDGLSTSQDVDENYLPVKIELQPTRAVKFIPVFLEIQRTQAGTTAVAFSE